MLMICFAGIFSLVVASQTPQQTNELSAPPILLVEKVKKQLDQPDDAKGSRALAYLWAGMPVADRQSLSPDFLFTEIDLAFAARREFPWASAIPEKVFFNDVLPYAVFDEPRDAWRSEFLALCRPLVKNCKTASEAAQILNREIFRLVKVHYNTGRKRANQSAKESRQNGRATCTGLSIILVNACRSVGIPARAAGTALWANERGNHTWVEIWDGDWHFTGADEYDSQGLNRGWFVADAAKARGGERKYAIFATSWLPTEETFPMVWSPKSTTVAAVNVTPRYAKSGQISSAKSVLLGIRLLQSGMQNGQPNRLAARLEILDLAGKVLGSATTKAGTSDWNDLARFDLPASATLTARVQYTGELRQQTIKTAAPGSQTIDLVWSEMSKVEIAANEEECEACAPGLSKASAAEKIKELWQAKLKETKAKREAELTAGVIKVGGVEMKLLEKTFGEAPAGGHSLWISMHGGGNTRATVNDSQWKNQIKLYELAEGIYVAPRAPTNTWNLWHENHIDGLFDRLIEDMVIAKGVDPNRVYLLGYSAGGDGVWQLAPRMADRYAAAAMMAGHPNNAPLEPLRNLPFAILMGGNDSAYKRNEVASEKAKRLDDLQKIDPKGYEHFVRIYPGMGHWMQKRDAEALPWLAKHVRNPWPTKVIWHQQNPLNRRYYWLSLPAGDSKSRPEIVAEVTGQKITIKATGTNTIKLRLSDSLLDLDRPVEVEINGAKSHSGLIRRDVAAIEESLTERFDLPAVATATLSLKW